MLKDRKRLVREQLDKTLSQFAGLKSISIPPKGWIRALREALGMSGAQFAERLGVKPPRITKLEKDELSGSLTIRSMRQAADALDAVFVYALVPRESLESAVRRQAERVAGLRLKGVSHSMGLEGQQLSHEEMKKALHETVEELMRTMPNDLWGRS